MLGRSPRSSHLTSEIGSLTMLLKNDGIAKTLLKWPQRRTVASNRSSFAGGQLVWMPRRRRLVTSSPFPFIGSPRTYTQKSSSDELYQVLGLTPKAKQEQIKATYFRLSKIYHPDVCRDPEGKEKFVRISKAYETLGNEEKRRDYDLRRGILKYPLDERSRNADSTQAREFSQEDAQRYQDTCNRHREEIKNQNANENANENANTDRESKRKCDDAHRKEETERRKKEKLLESYGGHNDSAWKALVPYILVFVAVCFVKYGPGKKTF